MNENLTSQLSARLTALTNLGFFFVLLYIHIFLKKVGLEQFGGAGR